MKFQFDRPSISSVLLTFCQLVLIQWNLKFAATWRTRQVWIMDRVAWPNYESSIAFASLAIEIIALIVIWTSYQKRVRWAWFVMAVFVCVYFVPVHLLDVFFDINRVGWSWWPGVIQDAKRGEQFAVGALKELAIFAVMVIALLAPVGDFFGKKRFLPSIKSKSD